MIKVKYFGMIAEATSRQEEKINATNEKLSTILKRLIEKYNLKPYTLNVAVNKHLISKTEEVIVKDNDEIAILPPFAGG
jgi:molybdopterin synthase sulfur carrier subunit